MTWVGKPIARFEDAALLAGRGTFVADLARDTRVIRFVRSPVARGTIRSIDIPEGITAFTASDLAHVRPIKPLLHRPGFTAVEQRPLAEGRVVYVGEPIVAVIGASAAEAEDLAEQVVVDIDADPGVSDVDAALADGAPLVHPHVAGNVMVEGAIAKEGVDEAFENAAHVVEISIASHRQSAMPLEARGAHAAFDAASGRVTLTTSVQNPHVVRTGIADCLDMPESMLRVVAPQVGGGFGQKMQMAPEYLVAVWTARRLRRNVAWIEDRQENLTASFHSRDQRHELRAAFDDNGRLLALDADIRCNVGAYSCYPVTCGVEPLMAMAELPGPYDFQAYRVRARGVATNTCPMAPYRGVSRPVLTLSMERLMDTAARRIGIAPEEIRRRNLIDRFPHTSPTGLEFDEASYRESLEVAMERIDMPAFRERQQRERERGNFLGIGIATFSERTGYGTPAFAARSMDITPGYEHVELAMDPSGYLEARIGACPHGQGLPTTLAQLIADEVGIDPARIRIVYGDTDRTPYGWGTFASRSLVIAGGACKLASIRLGEKLVQAAGTLLEAAPEDIVLADGFACVRGTDRRIGIPEVARAVYHQSHRFGGRIESGLTAGATYDPPGTFSNACHVAVVRVDPETGHIDLERFLVVEDAGRLINPMIVDGQIHGGVTQGIANALLERIVYDEEGNLLTGSLMDYLVPTASEVPRFEIVHLETLNDASVTQAKGLGEGGAIGAPAAVVNAVCDALSPFGVDVFEMPVTPQRVRELLRAAGK